MSYIPLQDQDVPSYPAMSISALVSWIGGEPFFEAESHLFHDHGEMRGTTSARVTIASRTQDSITRETMPAEAQQRPWSLETRYDTPSERCDLRCRELLWALGENQKPTWINVAQFCSDPLAGKTKTSSFEHEHKEWHRDHLLLSVNRPSKFRS